MPDRPSLNNYSVIFHFLRTEAMQLRSLKMSHLYNWPTGPTVLISDRQINTTVGSVLVPLFSRQQLWLLGNALLQSLCPCSGKQWAADCPEPDTGNNGLAVQ